jgi:type IV secretory pathway VirB10-like protein
MGEVPVTYVVSSAEQDSPDAADEDEDLQRALRLSLEEQQQSRSPQPAGGEGAGSPPPLPPPPPGTAWPELPPADHGGSWGNLGTASAPPLPHGQADWAEDFWRQQPGWQDGSAAEQQRQSAEAAAAAAAAADAAARYDAQLAADEALAQSLHEQELRQLSGEDRERLRRLPAMLAETPLVRRMSETLASLSGGSFSKVWGCMCYRICYRICHWRLLF